MKLLKYAKLFLALAGMFAGLISKAQNPGWQWARSAGGSDGEGGFGITTDVNGNVYVMGNSGSESLTFGNITAAGGDRTTNFIVKYNSMGEEIWVKTAISQGTTGLRPFGITTDKEGNVYMTGAYSDSITFDNIKLVGSYNDIFVVKLNTSGNVVWAKNTGQTHGALYGADIVTDGKGNLYVSGIYGSMTVNYGNTILHNNSPNWQPDIFLAKYNTSGDLLWVKSAGGTFQEGESSITVDPGGNVYMAGSFRSSAISFDNITLHNAVSDSSTSDFYITKYDATGNVLWAIGGGGVKNEFINAIQADASGNIFVTGTFSDASLTFGNVTVVGNAYCQNLFLFRCDSLGVINWGYGNTGTSNNTGDVLTIDESGNIVVAGIFAHTLVLGNYTLTSTDATDVYVAQYDEAGDVLYATSAGGKWNNVVEAISVDRNDNVFITGYFIADTMIVGNNILTNNTLDGNSDIYTAKLSLPTPVSVSISSSISPIDADIKVYPNPFTKEVNIINNYGNEVRFTLYNILGEQIISRELPAAATILDLSVCPESMYLYKVNSGGAVLKTGKIVRE